MTARESLQRLHNMSAPPRSTISFRLVTQRASSQDEFPATGLRWVCRIDVAGVFWPVPEGVPRDIAQVASWQGTLEPQRRLLAQALAEEGGDAQPAPELATQVDAMPSEAVLEALRDVARRADPAALGLPNLGLLRPARGPKPRRPLDRMRVAVAVLARRRGGIFLLQADPLPLDSVHQPLDLWTTEPSSGSQSRFIDGPSPSPAPRVVPAQAGTQGLRTASRWIPAFAGTTGVAWGGFSKGKAHDGVPA